MSNAEQRRLAGRILAPIDGTVVRMARVGAGETVRPGDKLVRISPVSADKSIEMMADGIDAPLLNVGRKVRILFYGIPAIPLPAWPEIMAGKGSNKLIGILVRAVTRVLMSSFMVVLFVVTAWAGGLNKSNSLTVENDPMTSNWTATCDISISGIDPKQIYSGRMLLQFAPSGQGSTFVFDALFQVDPANRTWVESSPGIYKVKANLRGHNVTVHSEVLFNGINAGDRFFFDSRIDQGAPPSGPTLFGANMVSTVQQP